MKTFWEMTAEERRRLLDPECNTPYSTRAQRLARLWAECDEDATLMALRYADEIAILESSTDMVVHKVRISKTSTKLATAIWKDDGQILGVD